MALHSLRLSWICLCERYGGSCKGSRLQLVAHAVIICGHYNYLPCSSYAAEVVVVVVVVMSSSMKA